MTYIKQVWTTSADSTVAAWKVNLKPFSIELVFKWKTEAPLKGACLMSDGNHVGTGSNHVGSISMWDVQTFKRTKISILPEVHGDNILCILDTDSNLIVSVGSFYRPVLV